MNVQFPLHQQHFTNQQHPAEQLEPTSFKFTLLSSGNSTTTGARSTPPPDGFITIREPARAKRLLILQGMIRHDIPIPPVLVPRAAYAGFVSIGYTFAFQIYTGVKKSSAERYLPYPYVPSYISRDLDEADVIATSWTCARCNNLTDRTRTTLIIILVP